MYLCWFFNGGFATNLVFRGFGGFLNLETNELISDLLILRETWPTFDKKSLIRPLDLGRGVHTFCSDSTLLNLKVYSSTFIRLKMPTWSTYNLKIQWWLIGDMLLSLLKKIRCKCLMGVADLCKRGVSQLNGGDYSPRGGRKCHIHLFESAYSINQNCPRRS
jgi:hypothetical protein